MKTILSDVTSSPLFLTQYCKIVEIIVFCFPLAGEKDNQKKTDLQPTKREDQLAHLNADIMAPASPAAPTGSQSDSTVGAHPTVITREDSVMSVSAVTATLPPDTQKFLKFAGLSVTD